MVALSPNSVATELPDGVVVVPLAEPTDSPETRIVWRDDEPSPTLEAFRSAVRGVYETERV